MGILLLLTACGGPDEGGFVKGMRTQALPRGIAIQFSDQDLLDAGHQICDWYQRGMTYDEIWDAAENTSNLLQAAIMQAELHLCPEYR